MVTIVSIVLNHITCRTSPEEFVARVEAQAEAKKPQPVKPKDFSLPSEPKALKAMGASGEKTLDKVMKLELLEDKTADEVAAIWTEFWSHKDAVSAAIPADVYKEMKERFDKFNTFLFPLPRDKVGISDLQLFIYPVYIRATSLSWSKFKGTRLIFLHSSTSRFDFPISALGVQLTLRPIEKTRLNAWAWCSTPNSWRPRALC